MKRAIIITLLTLLCLVLLFFTGAGILVATLNPNDYKETISAAVRKATGRNLVFYGDLKMSVFPRFSLKTEKLRLDDSSMFGGLPFATVENASFTLALRPLLERKIEVADILLDGVLLKLATSPDGRHNWDFSPVATSGVTSAREGVTPLTESTQESLKPAGISALQNVSVSSIRCTNSAIRYEDMLSGETYSMALENLSLANVRLDADIPVTISGAIYNELADNRLTVAFSAVARIAADGGASLAIKELTLTAPGKNGNDFRATATTALRYTSEDSRLTMTDLRGRLNTTDIQAETVFTLPRAAQPSPMPQAADSLREGPHLTAALTLGDVNANALTASLDAVAAALTRNAKSRALTAKTEHSATPIVATGSSGKKTVRPDVIPLSAPTPAAPVAPLSADVRLSVKSVQAAKITLSDVFTHATLEKGILHIPECSLQAFSGTAKGSAEVALTPTPMRVQIVADFTAMRVEDILDAFSGKKNINGSFAGHVETAAFIPANAEWKTVVPTLSGKGEIRVTNGAVREFSLIPGNLPGVKTALPTAFSFELVSATWIMEKGIASIKEIILHSALLTGEGGGTVDLPREHLNMLVTFLPAGQPPAIPLEVSGSFSSIHSSVDTAKMFKDAARDIIQSPEKAGKILKGVEGLFQKKR